MVQAIYTNRKGIYRDLYRTLEAENEQNKPQERRHKGIYANLYRQIEEDKHIIFFKSNKERNEKLNYLITFKKIFNQFLSKASYLCSSAANEIKVLVIAVMVAKKPISNYVENNINTYQKQNQNSGLYNER